jgi:hypothetical protein
MWFPGKSFWIFGCGRGKDCHCAESFIPFMWKTNFHRNYLYTCMWASLNITTYIVFPVVLLLLVSIRICLWEGASLSQTSVYVVKCVSTWNSMIRKVLPVLCSSSPVISITESIYKLPISLFLTCKCERHYSDTFAQWIVTPIEYNSQRPKVLLWLECTAPTLKTLLYTTFFASNYQ